MKKVKKTKTEKTELENIIMEFDDVELIVPYSPNKYEVKDFLFKPGNKAAEKWTEKEAIQFGIDMLNWFNESDQNIFFEEFLLIKCDRKKYRGRIYIDLPAYLSDKYKSFSDILKQAKRIEELKLKSLGSNGKANPQIVKFLLSAQYGYSENNNQNITITTPIFNIDPLKLDE